MITPFGYSFGDYCLFSYDVMKVFWAFYASYQYFFMEDDTGGVFFLVYGIILSFTIAIEFLGVMKEKSGLMKALVWFKLLECWIFLFLLITFLIDLIELSNKFRVLMIPEQYEKFSLQKKVLTSSLFTFATRFLHALIRGYALHRLAESIESKKAKHKPLLPSVFSFSNLATNSMEIKI